MNKYIESDLYRLKGKTSLKTGLKMYLKSATFRWQATYRLVRSTGVSKLVGHGGPVVINPTAHIGNNCNLSQFDTIGSNHGKAATIGDNVYIGPNVCIGEDVKVGNNVTIGAGSVVTKDIPDNATAVGNYA